MIPMRQLHTVVYTRREIIDAVGTEDAANSLAIELIRQAHIKIDGISTCLDEEDFVGVIQTGFELNRIATAAGAEQIAVFAKDLCEEACEENPSIGNIEMTLSLLVISLKRFEEILSSYI